MDKGFTRCGAVVFDFFDGKVGVCGDSESWVCVVDVDYDEDGVGNVVSEEFIDCKIRTTEFRPGMVPSYNLFSGWMISESGKVQKLPFIFLNMVFMSSM